MEPSPQSGKRIGPYDLLSPLGAGGMGEVWKARDTRLDRTVAIKFSKQEFGERFEREARSIAALNHPHICTLHDVGPNYLVMKFVDGSPIQAPCRPTWWCSTVDRFAKPSTPRTAKQSRTAISNRAMFC